MFVFPVMPFLGTFNIVKNVSSRSLGDGFTSAEFASLLVLALLGMFSCYVLYCNLKSEGILEVHKKVYQTLESGLTTVLNAILAFAYALLAGPLGLSFVHCVLWVFAITVLFTILKRSSRPKEVVHP